MVKMMQSVSACCCPPWIYVPKKCGHMNTDLNERAISHLAMVHESHRVSPSQSIIFLVIILKVYESISASSDSQSTQILKCVVDPAVHGKLLCSMKKDYRVMLSFDLEMRKVPSVHTHPPNACLSWRACSTKGRGGTYEFHERERL